MIPEDEVVRVARLARLKLEEREVVELQKKFTAILGHFEFLNEAHTEGVAPQFHATEAMELRPDTTEPAIPTADLLKNAPESFENCFRIPRVVGAEE